MRYVRLGARLTNIGVSPPALPNLFTTLSPQPTYLHSRLVCGMPLWHSSEWQDVVMQPAGYADGTYILPMYPMDRIGLEILCKEEPDTSYIRQNEYSLKTFWVWEIEIYRMYNLLSCLFCCCCCCCCIGLLQNLYPLVRDGCTRSIWDEMKKRKT